MGDATKRSTQAKYRFQWLDYVKGHNIFAIVLIHTLLGLERSGIIQDSALFRGLGIYGGNAIMPLFFMIAGMFVHKSANRSFRDLTVDRAKIIMYPYFLWATLYSVIHAIGGGHVNTPSNAADMWRLIYDPPFHYWFLYCVFGAMVVYTAVSKAKVAPAPLFVMSAFFYYSHEIMPLDFWRVASLMQRHMIFFAFGAMLGTGGVIATISQAQTRLLLPLGAIAAVLSVFMARAGIHDVHSLRPFFALVCGFSGMVAVILLQRFRVAPILEVWGMRSLEIYVAHTIFTSLVRIYLQKVLFVETVWIHVLAAMLAGLYGPLALTWVGQKLGFNYFYTLRPTSTQTQKPPVSTA